METKYGILTGTTEVFFLQFVVFSRLRACFFFVVFFAHVMPFIPLRGFYPRFSLPLRPLSVFTLLPFQFGELLVCYLMRALPQKRRFCAVTFSRLLSKSAGFVILRDVFVCVLCLTNFGFVQCCSRGSL